MTTTEQVTPAHHAIDYVEIGVTDLERARRFYAEAFGWRFTDYGPAYAGFRHPDQDREQGGLNAAGTRGRGGPLVLLWSADVDASAAAVVAAGGQVVAGPYDFPGGRRFHLLDSDGNELGVWGA